MTTPKENLLPRKIVIVYDSVFGNTEKVAQTLRDAFVDQKRECVLFHVADPLGDTFENVDLILFGSPTRAFKPTPAIVAFVTGKRIPLVGRKVAVFDTRIDVATIKSAFFRFFVGKMGYAAPFMAKKLISQNASLLGEPNGFFVMESEGPLQKGEPERAFNWVKSLLDSYCK